MNYKEFLKEIEVLRELDIPARERIINWAEVATSVNLSVNMLHNYIKGRVKFPNEIMLKRIIGEAIAQWNQRKERMNSIAQRCNLVDA